MLEYVENKLEHQPLPQTIIVFEDKTYEAFHDKVKKRSPVPVKHLITDEEVEYFTNPDFMSLVIENKQDCTGFGMALAHLCFENEKLSKKIFKFLLKGITSIDVSKIVGYL